MADVGQCDGGAMAISDGGKEDRKWDLGSELDGFVGVCDGQILAVAGG